MSDQPQFEASAKPSALASIAASPFSAANHPFSAQPAGDGAVGPIAQSSDVSAPAWSGASHPLAPIGKTSDVPTMAAAPAGDAQMASILPDVSIGSSSEPISMPNPFVQAVDNGAPVRFSSADENAAASRQPDFFLNTDGQMVPNPKATPSSDGSINVQIQSQDPQGNKSLRDAIKLESDNQKQAAQEMIRLYQKNHPGQPAPSWMTDLANAKPNLPDFVPFQPAPNAPVAPPPENGFVDRGVSSHGHGGSGGGGGGGFEGNGGFDGGGHFRGHGGAGDGMISTGRGDGPIQPGEQVQAKQLFDYFKDHGFTEAQASGILGNIQTESSFRTDAHNHQEGAIGFCQWEGPRRTELENFARQEGKPVTDWHVQADFVMHELTHKEHGAMAALKHAETPQEAARVFQSQYERSASLGHRAVNADHIYAQLHTPSHSNVPMA
jgi:hypothetical protein